MSTFVLTHVLYAYTAVTHTTGAALHLYLERRINIEYMRDCAKL
jgi:hypothetical protein